MGFAKAKGGVPVAPLPRRRLEFPCPCPGPHLAHACSVCFTRCGLGWMTVVCGCGCYLVCLCVRACVRALCYAVCVCDVQVIIVEATNGRTRRLKRCVGFVAARGR